MTVGGVLLVVLACGLVGVAVLVADAIVRVDCALLEPTLQVDPPPRVGRRHRRKGRSAIPPL